MISVAHVITSLDVGGAERALERLATGLRARGFRQLVVCLLPPGAVAHDLGAAGIAVRSVGMRPDQLVRSATAGVVRLGRVLRSARPDVVQTWMYHADVVGGLAARTAGRAPVVWNVRHADLPLEGYGRATAVVGRLSVPLSRVVPRVIVTNSAAGLEAHVRRGYPRRAMRLIPNGVPLPAAPPDRAAARRALGLPEDALVVGRVGRFHPQKDLPTLLRAVAQLRRQHPQVLLSLVGEGLQADNAELVGWVRAAGLEDVTRLHGRRDDAAVVPAAFDVAVSSSAYGENCPNAVLEAMAVGVPVVTTDVGDSARVVGDAGEVVPPRDPAALAGALARICDLPAEERAHLGAAAADRARRDHALATMVDRYAALYRELVPDRVAA